MKILTYAGLLLVAAAGCSDSRVPTEPAPQASGIGTVTRTSRVEEFGEQSAPEGVPPEYQVPTSLTVKADAGQNAKGEPYAQGTVEYWGTNARLRATVTLRENANEISEEGAWEQSALWPASRDLQESARLPMTSCGGTISANVYGEVWNVFLLSRSLVSWGHKGASAQASKPCSSSTGGGGSGGGGDGDTMTCYYVRTEYYEYDWTTGDLVYMGSESWSFCIYNMNAT